MLERKRKNKLYDIVPGEEPVEGEDGEVDLELGHIRERDQETGSVPVDANGQADAGAGKTDVTEELDNWDENAEDWDDEPVADKGHEQLKSPTKGVEEDPKKRTD